MLRNIQFYFVDRNKDVVDTYGSVFRDLKNVTVHRGNILGQKADCIVSPGNSYGCMDGGVDKAINYTLNYISKDIKEIINNYYMGEQPIGTCLLIKVLEENYNGYKYLAHTPTMRVPEDVSQNDNAYIAFRALLVKLVKHNTMCIKQNKNESLIKSVVLTSFCTGAGNMDEMVSAKQMRLAFDLVNSPLEPNWKNANWINSKIKQMLKH